MLASERCQPTHPPNRQNKPSIDERGLRCSRKFWNCFWELCFCFASRLHRHLTSTAWRWWARHTHQPCRAASPVVACKCYSKSADFLSQTAVCCCCCRCVFMPCVCLQSVRDLCGFVLLAFVVLHLQVCFHLRLLCIHAHLPCVAAVEPLAACLPACMWGGIRSSRFSFCRSVWPERCGTERQEYFCFSLSVSDLARSDRV